MLDYWNIQEIDEIQMKVFVLAVFVVLGLTLPANLSYACSNPGKALEKAMATEQVKNVERVLNHTKRAHPTERSVIQKAYKAIRTMMPKTPRALKNKKSDAAGVRG